MAFCVNCGTSLPQGALFCHVCGTDLRKFVQRPTVPQAEAPAPEAETTEQKLVTATVPTCEAPAIQYPVAEEPSVSVRKAEPGESAIRAGRILSIFGFALSVFVFAVSYLFMALTMSMESILQYKDVVYNMALVVAQGLCLSSFGLVFSYRGEKKSETKATLGKRFGWIGFVLSLVALANVFLIMIAFACSERILSV